MQTTRNLSAVTRMRTRTALAATATALAAVLWWRRHPSACPYSQRLWVQAPHPLITRARMLTMLSPQPGERMLEVGPGTGYYSLDLARALSTNGTLDIFDLQQEMLDHVLRRAREHGIENILATRGDARSLPYDDATFGGALLVTVLGEIPEQVQALSELARVLKPDGRLVVGELCVDPHMVSIRKLEQRARAAGLRLDAQIGPRLGYFARLTPVQSLRGTP
jgi:ubiquinone/menaquinone biosynthesis C-methylase UbiE